MATLKVCVLFFNLLTNFQYVYAVGLGVAHTAYGEHSNKLDFVPVDYVNNAILAAAWETTRTKRSAPEKDEIKIYTVSTATRKPITWSKIFQTINFVLPKSVSKTDILLNNINFKV